MEQITYKRYLRGNNNKLKQRISSLSLKCNIVNYLRIGITFIILIIISESLKAQDYVYRPINPAFGGNAYNYSWLLSSAEAQKPKEEDESSSIFDGFGQNSDPLANLTEQIQSQIVNELTTRILNEQFGDFSLEQGEYKVGNYQINITDGDQGLQIHILDTETGAESRITVPNL
jgi:curli production assembly/transport component CsgF